MKEDARILEALDVAFKYGGTDGEHHKTWVIDQMVRALAGEEYNRLVVEYMHRDGGPYPWDKGIAP